MKKVLYLILAIATLSACQNKKCVINGQLEEIEDCTITLSDRYTGDVIDSTQVVSGAFRFQIKDVTPTMAIISKQGSSICELFVEACKIEITGNYNDDHIYLDGTAVNKALSDYNIASYELQHKYHQAASETEAEQIVKDYELLTQNTYEANKDNALGLHLLASTIRYDIGCRDLIERLNALPAEVASMPLAQKLLETANKQLRVEPIGEDATEPIYINVVQPNRNGDNIDLKNVVEDSGNKYVLLDFWASWCGPCMGEVPTLVKVYEKYHKKGFEIYGVSLDRKAERWTKALDDNKMIWPNVSLLDQRPNQAADDYVVESIPSNFLIDCRTRVIIAKNLRGEDLEKKIAELFEAELFEE